jgi:hypothetical protein
MLQIAKKTHAQLQERSEQLEDTSSEIFTVKQALAAVMQQQQEVQCLVHEHSALTAAQDADASNGDALTAPTFQTLLEKLQRATLLEHSYAQRANLLRAAAEELLPESDRSASSTNINPEIQESIEKTQADLNQMEEFFLQSGSDVSASSQLLLNAKRAQLQELLSQQQGRSRLQPEDCRRIQKLLSSDHSLQEALDHEAQVAHKLELLKQQESARDKQLPQRQQHGAMKLPPSKESGVSSRHRRSGMRVQFSETEKLGEDAGADMQLKVYSVRACGCFLKQFCGLKLLVLQPICSDAPFVFFSR